MVRVIWRDWYNEAAVASMSKMGTLPRNEIEVDDFDAQDGDAVAVLIAEEANRQDSECFREGGEIVIMEPEDIAGTYAITVDWVPTFDACREDFD